MFLLLGSFVGFMAGLLGIGGGGILVPVLTSIFLFNGIATDHVVHLALGTSMACMVITTFSSFRSHNAKGAVVWLAVKGMVFGIILGTFSATFLASYLSSLFLGIFFALFMAFVSSQMFLNKKPKPSRELSVPTGLFAAGFGIGSISALVSIGGGSLTVPYLTWQNIEIKKAIGTSAAIGLPISVVGTVGYLINGWHYSSPNDYILGYVYLPAVVLISLTSFITAPLGAGFAHKLPVSILKKIFAVLLITLSIKMLVSIM
ncbi:sulfite exporter TauE/SafE family protein [Shewanella phaeophyticola]|uniref:Probable membrane transporter protein n=1 Tax=Shewanella phaeophyticola TaxID=2978345 RepID=A0ABT2P7U7_9GAMM|nr:sulfite exporter TauE/SafE family protein [Shewanella sp. KJ10-1]MCT8988491.1 sulfite exporter TauE/SafE family protein [Shewanella sp. KJ10-1]